ncbi:hypothetical protein [Modicisalibacter luteus]|uniref:hypothetical protein n=1 Tax=Modicisalibacter luteus TaxID=453962 RepID=UPI003625131F
MENLKVPGLATVQGDTGVFEQVFNDPSGPGVGQGEGAIRCSLVMPNSGIYLRLGAIRVSCGFLAIITW